MTTVKVFHAEDIYEHQEIPDKFMLVCRALVSQEGEENYVVEDFELYSDTFDILYDFKNRVNSTFEPIDIESISEVEVVEYYSEKKEKASGQ